MIGLADCNNFFVSCERRVAPELENRPVVVLSCNDGCVVSRSNEVKKLGVKMGDPFFKIRDMLAYNGVAVRSSNLRLYQEISAEVMARQGFDALCVDLQHGATDMATLLPMLQAISTTDTSPVVRVPWNDAAMIMKALDLGAMTVIVPMVSTASPGTLRMGIFVPS